MGKITVSGGQFKQDGTRFRFIGVNCYPLVQDDLTQQQLDNFFSNCKDDNISVVRTWCFNQDVPATNTVGNFRYLSGGALNWVESTFVSLDRVLASARKYNVRLILPLVDNNGSNKDDYCTWNDSINGTSYASNLVRNVATLTQTGNLATCTTTVPHGFTTDDRVTIAGAVETDYNLSRWITVTGATTFTYTIANNPTSPATGTITATRPAHPRYFYDDSNIRQMYKDFIDKLAARVNTINGVLYSDDDTIFSIELGNELRYDVSNDPNINTASSNNFAKLGKSSGWADVMSTYIKTKFPGHLVGYGDIAHTNDFVNGDTIHNGTLYGVDYTLTGALPNIDYFDFHVYPYADSPDFTLNKYGQSLGFPNASTAEGLTRQLINFIKIAKAAGKPCMIGEWGVDKRNTVLNSYPSYPRQVHFAKLFNDFFGADGDGALLWQYATSNILDDNNYNILPSEIHSGSNDNGNLNDDDSVLISVMAQKSSQINGKRRSLSQIVIEAVI